MMYLLDIDAIDILRGGITSKFSQKVTLTDRILTNTEDVELLEIFLLFH